MLHFTSPGCLDGTPIVTVDFTSVGYLVQAYWCVVPQSSAEGWLPFLRHVTSNQSHRSGPERRDDLHWVAYRALNQGASEGS